jgi:DNA-binding GntR family transcriptional regulator
MLVWGATNTPWKGDVSLSSTHETYEALRADVLSCRLRPGERLIIATLCERLDVSAGAVREALSRLTSEGLVTVVPQRGFRVSPISREDLLDLTKVRADIEVQCLSRSIACSDLKWESRLVAAHHELTRVPPRDRDDPSRVSEEFSRVHGRFHFALVSACGSPWLMRLRAILYDQSERYRRLSVPLGVSERDLPEEHRGIFEAALAHDTDRAVALTRKHLELTTEIILSSHFILTDDAIAETVA